ncbi:uncharacterized protein LOC134827439 [Culicoides brevitarsis]|uniref:uncharacterized protein LOC134827439 n=1 Tax=Culicoides brevitarsis TaxID=469753 RepID=UPI00307C2ED3
MMINWFNSLLVFLVVFSVADARIKFKKIEITSDENYVKYQHSIEEKDNVPYLSVTTEVVKEIEGEIIISGNISVVHEGKEEPITRILPVDLCKYLAGEKKSVLLKLLWDELGRHGSVPKSCPITKATYSVKDFTPDKDMIPAALPGGEYHINVFAELQKDGNVITNLVHTVVHVTIM